MFLKYYWHYWWCWSIIPKKIRFTDDLPNLINGGHDGLFLDISRELYESIYIAL